ncbi:unnamed protein product [Paramecium pentaurelia]|uniref:Uncharacterized protein n=1 Tax=Paramecium pentaurelia TaxID=43138 RepID=A0A8S1WJQ2_9CILI|nr:unnamed protein product [Paramecium pentaurelia]
MNYTVYSPNKKLVYQNKNGQQQLLSPDQKYDKKVQGLLKMIDSQFENMLHYQSSIENKPNLRTEPNEYQADNYPTKTVRHFKSQDKNSKTVLANLLNLVDSKVQKSTKLNHSISNTINDNWLTKNKQLIKTDQSVDLKNDQLQDRIKTQISNYSIQDASVQTQSSKQKKFGFFTYEISYISPKCKNCGFEKQMIDDRSIQNQRAESNYGNAFKEYSKNDSIEKCQFSKSNNKNQHFLFDQKIENQLLGINSITLDQKNYSSNNLKDLSLLQSIKKKNKNLKNFSQLAQDVQIFSPAKQEHFINTNIKQQKKQLHNHISQFHKR